MGLLLLLLLVLLLCCCQDVGQAEACGAAGSTEHKQLCKQLAAALCSLAEMRMALAEDVPEVSSGRLGALVLVVAAARPDPLAHMRAAGRGRGDGLFS